MKRRLPVLKYLFLFSRYVKGYPSSMDGKRKEYLSVPKVVYKRVLRGWTSERKGASQNKMLLSTHETWDWSQFSEAFCWHWSEGVQPRGGTPLYKPYGYVPLHRVGGLRRFGLKTGIHFAHFGLEWGVVFEGTQVGVYERTRFKSGWLRQKEKYANAKWIWRICFLALQSKLW